MAEIKSNQRNYALDILRIISVSAMIMIHVCADWQMASQVGSFMWYTTNFLNGMSRFCVPLFVMISGTLLLDESYSLNMKKLYGVKVLRLLTAFLFWGVFYGVFDASRSLLVGEKFAAQELVSIVFTRFCVKSGHLWFLPMIIMLYVLTPVLRKITQDRKLTEYLLAVTFLFTFVAKRLVDWELGDFSVVINNFLADSKQDFFGGYVFYFVLGYYINKYGLPSKVKKFVRPFAVLGGLLVVVSTYILSSIKGENVFLMYEYLYILVALQAVGIYCAVSERFSDVRLSAKTQRAVIFLSKYSFGVYLSHIAVFRGLSFIGLRVDAFFEPVSAVAIMLITLLISYLVTWIISKIPILNKYII